MRNPLHHSGGHLTPCAASSGITSRVTSRSGAYASRFHGNPKHTPIQRKPNTTLAGARRTAARFAQTQQLRGTIMNQSQRAGKAKSVKGRGKGKSQIAAVMRAVDT
ncbi:hypothetical protein NDU88_004131 [Pleurodeles waltl]|uniref:Uncharacterized protein n=1 Tax=Pleurodeles waltl TaxID=8319 RepID=A0AAV7MSL5_PLEWA|nr:hypothetical protein NDU88_004131 [Pleurodeles waltl]